MTASAGSRHRSPAFTLIVLGLIGASIAAAVHLELRLASLAGLTNLPVFFGEAFPPDGPLLVVALLAVVETLEIAFLGTMIGILLALPFTLLASANLFPFYVTGPTRLVLSAVRTLPPLIWALIFVIAVGFGPLAGVLAMAVHTVGYLGKLGSEAIEGMDTAPLEAVTVIGASKLQLIRFVALPEAANALISHYFFMLEYNVRASTILGFVGAGGIGYYVMGAFRLLQYDRAFTFLIGVFLTVVAIEWVGARVRTRFQATMPSGRAGYLGA